MADPTLYENEPAKVSKTDVTAAFTNPSVGDPLPTDLVVSILKQLPGKNVQVLMTDASTVTPSDVSGANLVLLTGGGEADLSGVSIRDIRYTHAIVATGGDDFFITVGGHLNPGNAAISSDQDFSADNLVAFRGVISTEEGNDLISLNTKLKDTISTGNGNDTVYTSKGKDYVVLGDGADEAHTGAGNDTISTGRGDDSIDSGSGNDKIYLGDGNDSVDAGTGNDIVRLAANFTGNAVIDGGVGNDKLDLHSVMIHGVEQNGSTVTITLDDGYGNVESTLTVTNFEKFIYDSSTIDTEGKIKTVGIDAFVNHDFSSSQ